MHAQLTIKLPDDLNGFTPDKGGGMASVSLEMTGCSNCMEKALTLLMVNDARFRELINRVGKAANEIRRGNGSQSIDPTKN